MDSEEAKKLQENAKKHLEEWAEDIRKENEKMIAQFKPFIDVSEYIERAYEPARIMMESAQQWSAAMLKSLQPTLEVIQKVQKNHEEGKYIRGEIITSIINLDEILEEIILKKFVKEDLHEEFTSCMFTDEACSSYLRFKIVAHSGLLDKYDGLKKDLQALLEIRNTIAHTKYRPTVQTVKILHKKGVKDIKSLKQEFDSIYENSTTKLEEIMNSL